MTGSDVQSQGTHRKHGMKYCGAKEINTLIRQLVLNGWVFRRGGKHGRLTAPAGKPTLTVPNSPSDRRALLNFRKDIQHAENRVIETQHNRSKAPKELHANI